MRWSLNRASMPFTDSFRSNKTAAQHFKSIQALKEIRILDLNHVSIPVSDELT